MPANPDAIASRLAMPGDPDLDADVDGLTITDLHIDASARKLLIHLADGFGRFVDSASGNMQHFPAGLQTARVTHAEVGAWLPAMPDSTWTDFVTQLQTWRDQATPLRMCSAPGRVTLLIEVRQTFLPFPRRPEPTEGSLP
ncbi:hypothetical protein AB0B10_26110 [Micromonospora arborensis]|uniref:hypothetical protein n=1 Tax=Micromonospora arborensis TaxID=2116518 RepID=UPI00340ACB9B